MKGINGLKMKISFDGIPIAKCKGNIKKVDGFWKEVKKKLG